MQKDFCPLSLCSLDFFPPSFFPFAGRMEMSPLVYCQVALEMGLFLSAPGSPWHLSPK